MSNDKLVTANIGSKLVNAAEEKRKLQISERIIDYVAQLQESIEKAEHIASENVKFAEFARKQIAAIQAGEFEFTWNWKIIYKDESLREKP